MRRVVKECHGLAGHVVALGRSLQWDRGRGAAGLLRTAAAHRPPPTLAPDRDRAFRLWRRKGASCTQCAAGALIHLRGGKTLQRALTVVCCRGVGGGLDTAARLAILFPLLELLSARQLPPCFASVCSPATALGQCCARRRRLMAQRHAEWLDGANTQARQNVANSDRGGAFSSISVLVKIFLWPRNTQPRRAFSTDAGLCSGAVARGFL